MDTSTATRKEIEMYPNPELMLTVAHEHQRALIAAADRKRLVARIGRRRHTRPARGPSQ